jgi:hypothetical protein
MNISLLKPSCTHSANRPLTDRIKSHDAKICDAIASPTNASSGSQGLGLDGGRWAKDVTRFENQRHECTVTSYQENEGEGHENKNHYYSRQF